MSNWETERDEQKLEYQVKAHVVLEDSDKETWGLAKFIESSFSGELGEVVGTWTKSPVDNCYHVFLETPIMALVDKATQHHADLVKKRHEGVGQAAPSPRSTPASGSFDELRKELKGRVR